MTRTGYTVAMGITALILTGTLYGMALALPWAWAADMPLFFLLPGTTVLVGFVALLGAALWMFAKERRELG
jgi:hypothetical protein